MQRLFFHLILLINIGICSLATAEPCDLWLEEVLGKRSLEWVDIQNNKTLKILKAQPGFDELESEALKILNRKEKIHFGQKIGDEIYNTLKNKKYVKGLIRRTKYSNYMENFEQWETVLDIDKLALDEKINWVLSSYGSNLKDSNRIFIKLSKGGGDTVVTREFDVATKRFIKDGFNQPEGKGHIAWINKNKVVVSPDLGGESLTTSGYPRTTRIWKRGTDISEAKIILEGSKNSQSVYSYPITISKNDKRIMAFERFSFF